MGWNGSKLTKPFTANNLRAALGLSATTSPVDAAGYFNGDVGTINHWSPIKPVRSDATLDVDMADYNYGFDTSKIVKNGAVLAISNAKSLNGNWGSLYLKPRGPITYNEWYRWEDFNGYEKNAVCPYSYSNISSNHNGKTYSIRIDKQSPSIDFSSLNVCAGKVPAIVYKTSSGNTNVTYENEDQSTSSYYVFDLSFDDNGTYECAFVYTTNQWEDAAECILMPDGYFTISVTGASGGGSITTSSSFSVQIAEANITPRIVDGTNIALNYGAPIGVTITRNSGTIQSADARISFTFICYNSGGDIVGEPIVVSDSNTISYPNTNQFYFNNGEQINLSMYPGFNQDKWDTVSTIEVKVSISSETSNSSWSMNNPTWTIYKS